MIILVGLFVNICIYFYWHITRSGISGLQGSYLFRFNRYGQFSQVVLPIPVKSICMTYCSITSLRLGIFNLFLFYLVYEAAAFSITSAPITKSKIKVSLNLELEAEEIHLRTQVFLGGKKKLLLINVFMFLLLYFIIFKRNLL